MAKLLQPQQIARNVGLCQSNDVCATLDSGLAARQAVRVIGGLRSPGNKGKAKIYHELLKFGAFGNHLDQSVLGD